MDISFGQVVDKSNPIGSQSQQNIRQSSAHREETLSTSNADEPEVVTTNTSDSGIDSSFPKYGISLNGIFQFIGKTLDRY